MVFVHDIFGLQFNCLELNVILFEILAANQLDLVKLLGVLGQSSLSLYDHVLSILFDLVFKLVDLGVDEFLKFFLLGCNLVLGHGPHSVELCIHLFKLLSV